MKRGRKREFEILVEYFVGRCLEAAEEQDKDEYVENLVDFRNIHYNYLDQRESLGDNANEDNSNTLDVVFSDYWADLYEELLDKPATYRNEVISAVTGIIRQSSEKGFASSFGRFLSILNRIYKKQNNFGGFDDDTKRFFIRRYSIIVGKVIEELKESASHESLDRSRKTWNMVVQTVRELLKLSIEFGDTQTYSKIMSEISEINTYEIVSGTTGFDDSLRRRKHTLGKEAESEISVLAFVLTAWAFRLARKGEIKEREFRKVASVTESERSSIEEISDIYYDQIRVGDSIGYWDRWDMNDKLEGSMGVVSTSPAVFSWLKEFFCYELFRLGEQVFIEGEIDLQQNPFPVSSVMIGEVERIEEGMTSIREDSIVQNQIDSVDVDNLIESISGLYKEAEDSYEQSVRDDIRESDLDSDMEEDFKKSVKKSFAENCTLRNTMMELGIISNDRAEEYESYSLGAYEVPRRALVSVDDNRSFHLIPGNYSNPIQDKFQDLVLEEVKLDRESIGGREELLEKVREYIDSREVKVILTSGATISIFKESDDWEYALSSQEKVFENQRALFLDTPVIRTHSNEFSVLLIYEDSPQLIEESPDDPISIELKSANVESGSDDSDRLSREERENAQYRIKAHVSYSCHFRSDSKIGVYFDLDSE